MSAVFRTAATNNQSNGGLWQPLTRPAAAVNGDLAIVTVVVSNATVAGWTNVAPANAPMSVLTRKYTGAAEDTFPDGYEFALLSVWSKADRVEQVLAVGQLVELSASGVELTTPLRTVSFDGSVYLWQASVSLSPTPHTVVQAPTSPLLATYTAGFVSGVSAGLVATASVASGQRGGYTQRLSWDGLTRTQSGWVATLVIIPTNTAPNAPLLLTAGSLNRNAPNIIDWEHSDPEDDGQGAARLFHRLVGAPAWTQVDVAGPLSAYEAPALSLPLGEHEYQVQTADTSGLWGARSSSGYFVVAVPPTGTAITAPVNGATIGTPEVVATWTGTGTSWELRTVAEVNNAAPSNPTPEQIFYSSGEQQVASVGRRWTVPLPVNSRRERLQIREKASGLFEQWIDVGYLVSYTTPAAPAGSVTVGPFALLVTSSNPAPSGGEPQVAYNELERAVLVDGVPVPEGDKRRGFLRDLDKPGRQRLQLPVRSTHADGTASVGEDYGYRFHAVGVNGTRQPGPWVTGPVDLAVPPEGVFADDVFDPAVFD